MDGYELCRQVRADQALADLPLILLTGLSDPEDVFKGWSAGLTISSLNRLTRRTWWRG